MLFAVTILGFGDFLILVGIGLALVIHYGRKYLASNPDVNDAAKKAAAKTTIGLIGKWLK